MQHSQKIRRIRRRWKRHIEFFEQRRVQLGRVQRRTEQVDDLDLARVEPVQAYAQYGRLADPDFAGDDDESLPGRYSILDRTQCGAVRLGREKQRRVGSDMERRGLEAVEPAVESLRSISSEIA